MSLTPGVDQVVELAQVTEEVLDDRFIGNIEDIGGHRGIDDRYGPREFVVGTARDHYLGSFGGARFGDGEAHAEASNLTGVVDRLEDRGLVARLPDPDDRRVKRVILTTTGHTTLDDLRAAFEDFPPITTLSPADKNQLTRILHRADADATARAETIDARHRRPT